MNARKRAKQSAQRRYLATCPDPDYWTVNAWRHQERHERRVIGHADAECDCPPGRAMELISWNQPGDLFMGRGHAYHRRVRARVKRR